jgi:hypothetical protein
MAEVINDDNRPADEIIIEHFENQRMKIKGLTDFLEYEEALTKDKDTASRITTLLKQLGVWS